MTPTLLVLVWGGLEVEMGNQIGDRIELSNFSSRGDPRFEMCLRGDYWGPLSRRASVVIGGMYRSAPMAVVAGYPLLLCTVLVDALTMV